MDYLVAIRVVMKLNALYVAITDQLLQSPGKSSTDQKLTNWLRVGTA